MELKKKLIEVSKSIGYLQKDKKNTMQNYSYLSEAKIKDTIQGKFEEHGIVFNYSTTDVREYEISPTSKGTKQFLTIASGTYKFLDADSDMEISGTWFGSGSDTGDKGLYKAITGGIKYVLNTNFLIPTGDDPEKDDSDNGNGKPPVKPKPPNIATDNAETKYSSNSEYFENYDWSKVDLQTVPEVLEWGKNPKTGKSMVIKNAEIVTKLYFLALDSMPKEEVSQFYLDITGKKYGFTYEHIHVIAKALMSMEDDKKSKGGSKEELREAFEQAEFVDEDIPL